MRELERFLLELGTDFSFIARQKRMTIGDRDFYLDLLFYHRGLRRLVAIELKLGSFDAAYKGQMELYLRWLDKYERRPGRILANVPGSFSRAVMNNIPNRDKEAVAGKLRQGFEDPEKMKELAEYLRQKKYSKSADTIDRFSQDI